MICLLQYTQYIKYCSTAQHVLLLYAYVWASMLDNYCRLIYSVQYIQYIHIVQYWLHCLYKAVSGYTACCIFCAPTPCVNVFKWLYQPVPANILRIATVLNTESSLQFCHFLLGQKLKRTIPPLCSKKFHQQGCGSGSDGMHAILPVPDPYTLCMAKKN